MNFETLNVTLDERGVATVMLNRPEKHNAMSAQMIAELTQAAEGLGGDDTVRVVVLTGAGKSFCAGADLGWMQAQVEADTETRRREARALADMLMRVNTLPKPVIGAIQGNAFGGGVGLAAVCDVGIGTDRVKMGLTETRLGLIPATIGPYILARMGEANARRVILSGRIFEAPEAVSLGLLSRIVSSDSLSAEVEAEVAHYLSCAPGAVAAAKKMSRELGAKIDEATVSRTIDALVSRWDGDEVPEGIAAFFGKRNPSWKK